MILSSKCFQAVVFCLLLVGKFNEVLAQSIEVKWGDEFMVEPRSDNGNMLGEDQEYYYLLTSVIKIDGFVNEVNVYSLETYSKDHNRVKTAKLELRTHPKAKGNFEAMYMLKGRFVLFFSEFDSKADLNILYSVNVDKEGKQDKPVMIDKAPAKSAKKSGRYSFVLSEDKARILVIRNAVYDKKSTEKFKYIMLADDMKTIWEKEVELPYMDKQFVISKYVIDETGNVFMLGTYKQDTSEISQYKLFAYDHTKSQLTELKVSFGDSIFIYDLNFFYTNEGLYIVGFCSKASNSVKGITGFFYNRMNIKSYQVEVERVEEFDKETVAKFITVSEAKKSKVFEGHYYKGNVFEGYYHIRDIIPRADGKIHLVAEDYRVSGEVMHDPSGRPFVSYKYNNNDIIVLQLEREGKIDWITRIPKKQESWSDLGSYSSYLLAYDDEHIYFLYNDNPSNAESFSSKEGKYSEEVKTVNLNNLGKATIVLATVNNTTGELAREIFGKTKEKGSVPFITANYARMTKDRIWIVGEQGRKRKFGFLTLKGNG